MSKEALFNIKARFALLKTNLNSLDLSNIRVRIAFLTVFTLIPLMAFVSFVNVLQLRRSEAIKIDQLNYIAHSVALENEQIVEGARQLLITLSVVPDLKYPSSACSQYLSGLLIKYQRYGNIGVTNSVGDVICSAIPLQSPHNLSDRYFFQEALKSGKFTIGEYVLSRATNQSSVNFGYPLSNKSGVVYATLNLDWLNQLVKEFNAEKGSTVLVLDRTGVVLARYPDPEIWVGKSFPDDPLVNSLSQKKGILETSGIDGVLRLYAYERIGSSEDGPFVVVGQTKSEILKNPLNDYRKSIGAFVIVAICSLILGVFLGNSIIAKAVEKTKELESLKRDFISLASHQIRTPATAIKWFTQILLSRSPGVLTKKQESILKDTNVSIKRMIELIGTLLNVSKLESGRLPLNLGIFSLLYLVKSVAKEVKTEFKNKKIRLKIDVTKNTPPKITADERLIRQALLILLHNAFKYSHIGGSIVVNISKTGNKVFLRVKDQGIGIPAKEKKNLFQKFSRASNARFKDTDGAGLGLYLAKLIVEAHHGSIRFENVNKGTSVLVSIPLR